MTTTTHTQVAQMINDRLLKLGASEARSIVSAISARTVHVPSPDALTTEPRQSRTEFIPKQLVHDVLNTMTDQGQLRSVAYQPNSKTTRVFYALPFITREAFMVAAKRSLTNEEATSGSSFHQALSLQWYDTADQLHHSETEDGCLAVSSVTDQLTAETTPWETEEVNRIAKLDETLGQYATRKPERLSLYAAQNLAYQDKINQGPRNTQRVQGKAKRAEMARKQAFLATPEGEAWIAKQRRIDDAKMDIALSEHHPNHVSPLPSEDDDVFTVAFG